MTSQSNAILSTIEITHFHLFCGLGGAAAGFNQGQARVGTLSARFRCLGGIDADPAAVRDFGALAGVPGTVRDLFDRAQYQAWHGHEPPADWREATPEDLRLAAGNDAPDILFSSPPCKGFSGLLSSAKSETPRYQALMGLTLRGIWLALEAWADDPPKFFVMENVPRIATRGAHLLDQIEGLLGRFGYASARTTHDCGHLAGLSQSRKRFILVARHIDKVPPHLYEPPFRPLRGIGETIGRLPLPGDPGAGPMHSLPALKWKTWVRLAFVPAGGDWRDLQRLSVGADGNLADYLIVPEMFRGAYGVTGWDAPAGTITGDARVSKGGFAVADPRGATQFPQALGVMPSEAASGTGEAYSSVDCLVVADPRRATGRAEYGQYGVLPWTSPSQTVTGQSTVGGGRFAVADPRMTESAGRHVSKYRVMRWESAATTITGTDRIGSGAQAVADPRVKISGANGFLGSRHYGVVPWAAATGAVTGAAAPDNGPWNVADPRLPTGEQNCLAVIQAEDGTWHRPLTTLELAALQGLVSTEVLVLDGASHSGWRERIGNAVPPPAAAAIASEIGLTLMLARVGESFRLADTPVWVRQLAVALSVRQGIDHA